MEVKGGFAGKIILCSSPRKDTARMLNFTSDKCQLESWLEWIPGGKNHSYPSLMIMFFKSQQANCPDSRRLLNSQVRGLFPHLLATRMVTKAALTYLWNMPAKWPREGPQRWRTGQRISNCSIWRASSAWRPSWRTYSAAAGGVVVCKRFLRSKGILEKSCWTGVCFRRMSWRGSACKEEWKSQPDHGWLVKA